MIYVTVANAEEFKRADLEMHRQIMYNPALNGEDYIIRISEYGVRSIAGVDELIGAALMPILFPRQTEE